VRLRGWIKLRIKLFAKMVAKRGQFREVTPVNLRQAADLKKAREKDLRRKGLKAVRFCETYPNGTHIQGTRLVIDEDIRAQGITEEMKAYDVAERGPEAVLEHLRNLRRNS
jgi:hypothetical protein